MSLANILTKVASSEGHDLLDVNTGAKAALIDKVNDAAEELWNSFDPAGCLRECSLKVIAGKYLALPWFVGEVRAVRDNVNETNWRIDDLRERYVVNDWKTRWSNFRFVGYSPIQSEITNAAPLTFTIQVADPTVRVTVTGRTINSARAFETVTLSSVSNVGTLQFIEIESIRLNKHPNNNVVVLDVNGTELATIPNSDTEARYVILDVSDYPSAGSCPDGSRVMDVLYKKRLPKFVNDSDEFLLPDWDKLITAKTIQLLLEGQEGKEERAILAQKKLDILLGQKRSNSDMTVQRRVEFARPALMDIQDTCNYGVLFARRF